MTPSKTYDVRSGDFKQLPFLPSLRGQTGATKKVAKLVGKMLTKVEAAKTTAEGEAVIKKLAQKIDGFSGEFKVEGVKSAQVAPELYNALELAGERIRQYYMAELPSSGEEQKQSDIFTKSLPLECAGIYVPGGKGKYPSSVLMNAIPAKIAGVKKVIVATPPDSNGQVSSEVLVAAKIAGVDEVYTIGGAQAIAAMAYGYCLPKVDIICGPGNEFVAQAIKAVAGLVGVPPGLAGPSEIAIVADSSANPSFLALDLMAQMEHGVGGWAWVISWEEEVLSQIESEIVQLDSDNSLNPADIHMVLVDGVEQAIELINLSAPEHLQINTEENITQDIAGKSKNAGAIFCGLPVALGDYIAGPSHTLPTGGSARFSGVLRVADFQKAVNVIGKDGTKGKNNLFEAAAIIAEAEGFTMHAKSLRARIK